MGKRILLIAGAVLLGLGLWVFSTKPEFERDKEVLKLGELSATVRDVRAAAAVGRPAADDPGRRARGRGAAARPLTR